MFSNIEEVLNSMRIVKAFRKEDYEHKKLAQNNNQHFLFWRRSQVYWTFGVPISEMSSVIIGITILFIGGVHILEEGSDFSFGDFTAFLFAIFSMMKPLKAITNDFSDVRRSLVSVDRVSEILEMKSEITEVDNPVVKTDFTDKIEFKDVCFSYKDDVMVLKDCSFEIKKGQKVAFVGSSGSGKTTIANLINRMYDASSGEVLIDGVNVKEFQINELRKLFGIVTQESILFSDTIENNIKYGSNDDKTEEDVKMACHFAYADEFIDRLPDKYQTEVFPRGSNLSGGQKQRLCIARAIIDNPPILIFDEATSALDTDSEQKVQKAIDMAAGNRTVIIIAHRLSTIMSADKIFVLDQGEIIGVGKHEELMEKCERYRMWF
jgi:subfamily B ATP-binding cassette protein MsbA